MRMRTMRTASLTAVAVAAASVTLVAAPAATAAPADTDVTGAVTNVNGTPLVGVEVDAYTTPADGSAPKFVSDTTTNASGVYAFTDLDPASLAAYSDPAIATETEFKLFFYWSPNTAADYHSTGYLDRGLGGSKNVRTAGSVIVPANAAVTAPVQTLPTAAGVLVTLTGPTGAPLTDDDSYAELYQADAYDPFDSYAGGASAYGDNGFYDFNNDGTPDTTPPLDGQVWIRGVEPGDYFVSGSGGDYNATLGIYTGYLSRFFGGDGSYPDAKSITANAGGFTPVTIQLTSALTALQKPQIIGNSSVGSKLKADPGTWLRQQGTDFSYTWMRNKDIVATGDTYKLTKKDRKKKIRLVVTATNGNFVGSAMSDKTGKVGEKSKVTVKKAGAGSYAVSVKVVKKALAKKIKVSGKVALVTESGELASKKVTLKGGSATVKLKAKFLGEKVYVKYFGNNRLGSDTATIGGKKKK